MNFLFFLCAVLHSTLVGFNYKVIHMPQGTVKWFNARKGFGFIVPEEGEQDIFVHYTAIQREADEFATLYENDKVSFEIHNSDKGPEARDVKVTERAPNPRSNRGGGRNRDY